VAKPSPRRPRQQTRRSSRGKGSGSGLVVRIVLAVAVLGAAVVSVLLVARRWQPAVEGPPGPSPGDVVREAAARWGEVTPDRVVEQGPVTSDGFTTVTVHAPRRFATDRFVQDMEARAHNSGDRLEPRQVAEAGGYGLARLDGTLAGRKVRIVVIGDEPRRVSTARAKATPPARLAIVLDDAGSSLQAVRELEELPQAVAVAVLPNAPQSREVVRELERQGREVLLHMPMEPLPNHGPGPGAGAVSVGQTPAEVGTVLDVAIAVVSTARGLNNHMGSRATADPATMRAVMAWLKGRGLYFLDSRTTPDSVAERVARAAGVPSLRREVFLDTVDEPDAVRRQLAEAISSANAEGRAVAIGHVHAVTIAVLAAELGSLPDNVRLVRPSALVD
jgi:uncharacterized protein